MPRTAEETQHSHRTRKASARYHQGWLGRIRITEFALSRPGRGRRGCSSDSYSRGPPNGHLFSCLFGDMCTISKIHTRIDVRISSVSCNVGDTSTDITHPHPRLTPTGIFLRESRLLRLQILWCHPCQIATLDVHHHARVDGFVDKPPADAASQS